MLALPTFLAMMKSLDTSCYLDLEFFSFQKEFRIQTRNAASLKEGQKLIRRLTEDITVRFKDDGNT